MGSKQNSSVTAETGQPASLGGDDFPKQPADSVTQGGSTPVAARRSVWQRVAVVVTAASAVLAVFCSGVLYADLRSGRMSAAATTPQPLATPAPRARSVSASPVFVQVPSNIPAAARPAAGVRGAPPVRISIAALKIDQRLVGLRVNANRQLEVPKSYQDIGWWSTGPSAGDQGAAVVVGHLDSPVGPAVFQRLSSLNRGDTVAVRRADGTTVKFKVTKLQSFSKERFPDKLVYRTKGHSALHLVTCGGNYDPATGYRDNVVVFADKIEPKPAAQAKPAPGPRAKASGKTTARATAQPSSRADKPGHPSKPRKAKHDEKGARGGN